MFVNFMDKTLNENGFWNDLDRLHNELSRGFFANSVYSKNEPAINYYVNEDGAAVYCLVPGFSEDQFEISVNDKKLEISGKREKIATPENTRLVLDEISQDEFSRSIDLPFRVETDAVEAVYQNGILKITLPKAESEKPKKIKIN